MRVARKEPMRLDVNVLGESGEIIAPEDDKEEEPGPAHKWQKMS